jgi:hypothetical protein
MSKIYSPIIYCGKDWVSGDFPRAGHPRTAWEAGGYVGDIGDEDATLACHPPGGFSSNQFKRGSIYLIATLTNSSGATLGDKFIFVGIIIYAVVRQEFGDHIPSLASACV